MSVIIFERLLSPIKKKIMLMVGRCILAAVNNSGKIMRLQLNGLKKESINDVERYQEYGLETYPKKDSEALVLFIDGNRDNGIAICVNDRRYRPTDLVEGDVCVYDANGNKAHLKSDGINIKDKFGNEIQMGMLGITLKTGDAAIWNPNILAIDPATGLPHGGTTAGIVKLKGG